MSFNDLLDLCENKLKDHIIYARVLHDIELLENKYKVMDLSNPMIDDKDKMFIDKFVENTPINYLPSQFIEMYQQDQLGGLIRNVDVWIKEVFENLLENK